MHHDLYVNNYRGTIACIPYEVKDELAFTLSPHSRYSLPKMLEPNKILLKMQDRLLAALVNGPSLNCRPYASRQRLDLVQLCKLGDMPPEAVLRALLGPSRQATIKARVAPPKAKDKDKANGKPQKLTVAASIEAADEHGAPAGR